MKTENINWQNAETEKPPIDVNDKFSREHQHSVRVLVRVVDRRNEFQGYSFGQYFGNSEHWNIQGFMGSFKVTHFAVINEPDGI